MQTYCTVDVIAVRKDGRFLLLQRAPHRSYPHTWNCISGHIREKESAESAAVRELMEEAGLVGNMTCVGTPHWTEDETTRFIVVPTLIVVTNEDELCVDPEESCAYDWVTPDDVRVVLTDYLQLTLRSVGMLDD